MADWPQPGDGDQVSAPVAQLAGRVGHHAGLGAGHQKNDHVLGPDFPLAESLRIGSRKPDAFAGGLHGHETQLNGLRVEAGRGKEINLPSGQHMGGDILERLRVQHVPGVEQTLLMLLVNFIRHADQRSIFGLFRRNVFHFQRRRQRKTEVRVALLADPFAETDNAAFSYRAFISKLTNGQTDDFRSVIQHIIGDRPFHRRKGGILRPNTRQNLAAHRVTLSSFVSCFYYKESDYERQDTKDRLKVTFRTRTGKRKSSFLTIFGPDAIIFILIKRKEAMNDRFTRRGRAWGS